MNLKSLFLEFSQEGQSSEASTEALEQLSIAERVFSHWEHGPQPDSRIVFTFITTL